MLSIGNSFQTVTMEIKDSDSWVLEECKRVFENTNSAEEKVNKILKIKGITIELVTTFVRDVHSNTEKTQEFMTILLRDVLQGQVKYKEKKQLLPLFSDDIESHEELLYDLVSVLLDKGASVDGPAQNIDRINKDKDVVFIKDQPTLLMIAIKKGLFEIANLLIEQGADIHAIAKYKAINEKQIETTALLLAVQKNSDDLACKVIDSNVDIEVEDQDGNTVLNFAAIKGFTQIVRLLLDNNPNLESKNKKGHTPLANAAIFFHSDVVHLLCRKGANVRNVPIRWGMQNLQTSSNSSAASRVLIQQILEQYKK